MAEFIAILVVAITLSKLFKKSKKSSGAATRTAKKSSVESVMKQIEGWFQVPEADVPTATGSSYTPAQPTVEPPPVRAVERKAELLEKYGKRLHMVESFEGHSRPLQSSEELAAGRAAGSMAYHSDEGQDVCDPTLGHGESSLDMNGMPIFTPDNEEEPLFSASDMVRGFVMSEIFTRPGVNRWKR